jgi:hypothetical protein
MEGFLAGDLACDGSCALDSSGCTNVQFVDNGNGTITDNETGLMWEKKLQGFACLSAPARCVTSTFTFAQAFSDFLPEVNGKGSADGLGGHNDWRLPSFSELATIFDCSFSPSCIDPIFGPTADRYWCSQNCEASTTYALGFDFDMALTICADEANAYHVRAVRGIARP